MGFSQHVWARVASAPDWRARAQVKRSQAHLLEHLYSAVTSLAGSEAEFLLEEDPEAVQRRERVKKVRVLGFSGLRFFALGSLLGPVQMACKAGFWVAFVGKTMSTCSSLL